MSSMSSAQIVSATAMHSKSAGLSISINSPSSYPGPVSLSRQSAIRMPLVDCFYFGSDLAGHLTRTKLKFTRSSRMREQNEQKEQKFDQTLFQKLQYFSSLQTRLQCQNQKTSVFLLITIQMNKFCNTDYLLELPLWQLKTVSGPCLLAVCRRLIQFGLLCLIFLAF